MVVVFSNGDASAIVLFALKASSNESMSSLITLIITVYYLFIEIDSQLQ